MARNLLSWKHSGFSIDNSVMLYPHDDKAKVGLAQFCTKCGGEMKVVAVIVDSFEVKKILRHLVKTGKSPPGFYADALSMVS